MTSVTPLSRESVESVESVESLYMIFKVTFMRSVTYAQTEAFVVNICADESVQSVYNDLYKEYKVTFVKFLAFVEIRFVKCACYVFFMTTVYISHVL